MSEVHIAGMPVELGGRFIRQRCAWCGTTMIDVDLARIAVPDGQDPRPALWDPGEVIRRDGPVSTVVDHEDGTELPDDCCVRLDPAVTA